MKRIISLLILAVLVVTAFSSCSTVTIPNSEEAQKKLEKLGYVVNVSVQYGDKVSAYNIKQVTKLSADKGDDFVEVYFFTSEEDTNNFYDMKAKSFSSGVEIVRKNKYSIYRGTQKAVDDFLG